MKCCEYGAWANVIKPFTAVIYRHSMVLPSFCVIKQNYLSNNCRMEEITIGKFLTSNLPWNDGKLLQYDSKLPQYFNP